MLCSGKLPSCGEQLAWLLVSSLHQIEVSKTFDVFAAELQRPRAARVGQLLSSSLSTVAQPGCQSSCHMLHELLVDM